MKFEIYSIQVSKNEESKLSLEEIFTKVTNALNLFNNGEWRIMESDLILAFKPIEVHVRQWGERQETISGYYRGRPLFEILIRKPIT